MEKVIENLQKKVFEKMLLEIGRVAGKEITDSDRAEMKKMINKNKSYLIFEEEVAKHFQIFDINKRIEVSIIIGATVMMIEHILIPVIKSK